MDKILWELFRTTGDIKYFLLLQRLEVDKNGNYENRGNSSKRD